MHAVKPICFLKCLKCIYYYTDSCTALHGDNFFSEVKENQIELLIRNKERFNITSNKIDQLINRSFSREVTEC